MQQCDNGYAPPHTQCSKQAEFQEKHLRNGIRFRRVVCREHLEELLTKPHYSDQHWRRLGSSIWLTKDTPR